ncbi:MAG: hypothetical protein IKN59_08895 [Paludibacteraceae bacterium]|nr:hypothetical protein [Paludibacteraceae bacterium]
MKQFLVILTALFSVTCFLNAATYYCSPNGNGNGNSYSAPCSLTEGISKLSAGGDTLYLLGGQYNLGKTTISGKNGASASNYMVISGYPGEVAILDFRTTAYGTRGLQISSNCTYLHIKDLTLRYSGKNNLYNEGSYCFFERLDIYGSADTGCQMKGGGHNIIKNVDSHDNFDYELMSGSSINYGGNADGFADKQFTGPGNHYIGCRAWNNSDDGWDFYQRVSNSETIIEDCICYQNGPAEYDMRNHARYNTDKNWFDSKNGITVTTRYGTEATVTMEHYPNMGNGNGFKLGGAYTQHNVLIHHCLAISNTVRGFDQNNNAGVMRVFNNTAYANGRNFGFYANDSGPTLTIQNNISYPSSAQVDISSTTLLANDHNTWNSGTGITLAANDFLSLDTTQVLRPRLADGSITLFSKDAEVYNTLFHLAQGSDLRDAGIDIGLPYTSTAPDLGSFETDGTIRPFISLTSGPAEQWVLAGDSITPIVFTWGGTENKPTNTKPEGITHKISNNNKTITFTGVITTAGTYTVTATTAADSLNVTASATIHVRPANLKRVAFVTIPGSESDAKMLEHLNRSDSIILVETNANDAATDYSSFDAIVLGPAPNSGASGFTPLKGYNKPMLVLKPFLFKASVWNWGASVNTSDVVISVMDTTHTIFHGLLDGGNELTLFSACNTNAVTAISAWENASGEMLIATPKSNASYSTITEFPAGSSVGGTTFSSPLLMLGISEYSTANLTQTGLRLVENAIYYLLGLPMPDHGTGLPAIATEPKQAAAKIIYRDGQLLIERGGVHYSITGQRL